MRKEIALGISHKDRPKLSEQEHIALGKELYSILRRLNDIRVDLSHRYPREVYDVAGKAADALNRLRSKLDDVWCEAGYSKGKPEGKRFAYYPGDESVMQP